MHLLVGLGNPGPKYAETRHNVGFILVDALAETGKLATWKTEGKALTGRLSISGHSVLLVKPQTFMNLSGEAALSLMTFYKVPPENVIVVVDDVYLPVGAIRIRRGGSAGGHNGLKSLIGHLGENFVRIRIGVGPCPEGWDLADFVLGRFGDVEKQAFAKIGGLMDDLVRSGLEQGWEKTGNLYNRKA
jgi:peptidyl-tRNA hydrolase, PTH1 family